MKLYQWIIFKSKKLGIPQATLPLYIADFKVGLFVAVIASVIAASDTFNVISMLKPLLDEGFTYEKIEDNFLVWMPAYLIHSITIRGY